MDDDTPRDVAARAAHTFDVVCSISGLTNAALAERIAGTIGRPRLTRQTVAAWRSGSAPVPVAALMAVADLAGRPGRVIVADAFDLGTI